jgi:hypothetical protein
MGRQYNRRQKKARGKALLKRRKKALKLHQLWLLLLLKDVIHHRGLWRIVKNVNPSF